MSSNIKQLIGYFNLDPNRVLDIILEAFEFSIERLAIDRAESSIVRQRVLDQISSVFMNLID